MPSPTWSNDVLVVSGAEQLARVEKRRDSQTLVVAYPVVDGDIPVLEQVMQVLRDDGAPWTWHLLFNLTAFEGYERFEHIEAFAANWQAALGKKGQDRRMAVVSTDPLMVARFRTGSYQALFGTHACVLFSDTEQATAWLSGN